MAFDAQRGARLQEERRRLHLTQQAAADAIGVRREMWARYEGGAEPGADVIGRMAEAGIDVGYVITGEDPNMRARRLAATVAEYARNAIGEPRADEYETAAGYARERRLVKAWRRCTPPDQETVTSLAERLAKTRRKIET